MLSTVAYKIVLLGCMLSISGYDLSCPHRSQRTMRVKDICNGSVSSYTCLYDTEKKNYIEECANNQNNFVRPGLKYVITGMLRNVVCSDGRYQPIKFWANQNNDCLYSKSQCNGIGQSVYDNRSTIYDATCRCDYIRGYAFVSEPRNKCFCTSSEEDCSCYIKQCPNYTILSPDYECASTTLIQEQYNCQPLQTRQKQNKTESTVSFQDKVQLKDPMSFSRILFAGLSVCCVIACILVGVFLVFARISVNQRDLKHNNRKNIKSDNSHVHNIKIESLSNEAFPTTNDNSLMSESDIHVIRKPYHNDNFSLINACLEEDISKINSLIEKGADTNTTDKNGNTPLSFSCYHGNIDIVNLLIDTGCDINKPDNDGMTPLMKACRRGHLLIVARLIERGADIDTIDRNENTPLSLSCNDGNIDMVNVLIDNGCEINKANYFGRTPLMQACARGHRPIVAHLIEIGADINTTDEDGNTPLSLSCYNGNIDMVNLLIDKGCDIDKPDKDGMTPLMKACREGHLPVVVRLIERGADINTTDKNGNTPLSLSCNYGIIDLVNLLIDKGCDIDKPNNDGITPLINACFQRHLPIIVRLIEKGADINTTDKDGDTPLSLSCDNGNIDIVNLLTDKGCDIHKPDNAGMTPLMKACRRGHLPIVARLIKRGADINTTDKDGNNSLSWSCMNGNIDIVNLLIDNGCDIHKPNNAGMTPLMKACDEEHLPIVARLIERGVDINTTDRNGDTPLALSCTDGNIDIINLLIDNGCDIHKPNNAGMTPLMISCDKGHLPIVARLIERGVDINTTDEDGDTPFSLSCNDGNIDIVNLLIDNGCDINKPDNDGMTPLMNACHRKHLPIVARLIERGADINTSNKNGETALSLASTGGNNDIVNLLLDKVSDELKSNVDRKPQLTKGTENEDMVIEKGLDIQTQELNVAENPEYLLPFAGSSEDFNKLLSTGTYESFENRVFLCGSCACGKSTLASVLIGSTIPLTWKSTNGLVIHFGRNGINLETHEMVPLTGGVRDQNVLTKVVIGKPNRETVIRQSVDTNQDKHIAPSSTDFPKSNQQTIKKDTDFSFTVSHASDVFVEESKDLPVKSTLASDDEKAASVSLPKINKIEAYAVREDILKEIKSGKYKIKIAPSDLVDFGGQRSYDMTHQLFVQHGGTFVVMFDGSRDFHEPLNEYPTGDISNETIVKHWVNSILTYCVDDSDVADPMPMIVFAATHSDLISENKQEKMKKEFAKKVTKMFGTHEMKKHIVFNPVYFINGTDKDDLQIKNLKNQLVSIAVNQSSWGQRRPMIWVPLELLIDNMKKDNIYVILKTHLAEANTMNGELALSDKQLDDFLLTQHALGKLMYFNQPELNSFIILYPPALVNILKSFVTDEMFWPEDETLKNILRKMTDTGVIKRRDLMKLWLQKQVNQYLSCDEFKEYVIQVLVHLDILVLPKRYIGKTDVDDYFLVPCTAKNKMPMSFLEDKSFEKRTITLVYKLRKRFIPSSLTFKLIGAVSGIWPIKKVNGRPLLYHSSAVIYVDSKTEFRIIVEDTRIIVYLTHTPSKFTISPDIAASIQECLTFTLTDVLKFYLTSIGKSHNNIDVSKLFQIEVGEVCDSSPCVFSISEAKRSSSWTCCSRNQHLTKYPLLWIFDKTQGKCPPDCTGLHVDALSMLPSDKHLVRLACQLDIDRCKELVFQLGLQETHWENVNHAYGYDAQTLNTMVLYTWMNTKIIGKSTTKSINDLHAGLKAIDADTHVLCKVFREYTDFSEFPNVGPEEVPNDDVLNNLPQKLGNCALHLGVELGISINSIEQTKTDYRKMYDQTADILRKWKNSTEEKPTVFKLLVGLERVHLGGFQFVKEMYLRK